MPLSSTDTNKCGLFKLGFGTYQASVQDTADAVAEALRVGYRHIDTAEIYKNEEGVGKAVRASGLPREELFITTKLFPGCEEWGYHEPTYEEALERFHQSLKRLDMEYVDLYLVHAPLAKTKRLDQYKALVELKKQGLVKHIGVSNYGKAHLLEIQKAGLPMPECNQIELHPLHTQKEILAFMKENDIEPIVYSSLAPLSSWRSEEGQGGDVTYTERMEISSTLDAIAAECKKSTAQILLRWALQHNYAILPKSTKPKRIQENFQLFDFELTDTQMQRIDALNKDQPIAWSDRGKGFNPLAFE